MNKRINMDVGRSRAFTFARDGRMDVDNTLSQETRS